VGSNWPQLISARDGEQNRESVSDCWVCLARGPFQSRYKPNQSLIRSKSDTLNASLPPQSSNLLDNPRSIILNLGFPFPSLVLLGRRCLCLQPQPEVTMQNGSVIRRNRKRHSDIWQFRWWESTPAGKRIYRRKEIGTVDQIPDLETARKAAFLLVPDLNVGKAKLKPASMTVAQLCSHFEQNELSLTNTWRSYSTKNIYKVYLKRWIIPKWSEHLLSDIRTIEVESWLRSLPIARSTCAKIRNVMSVLFNHACRYEFFDGNPIRLVCQSAKRRSPPVVLTAGEIRILLEGLKFAREPWCS
jgi:hypothetical protein